ncbi:MAG: heavy metal-associated domain-containing protein [Bacteroidota bacterium]|nr:heavy metal-associated domain-containing protein [Bacteroidota bacterium]
MKKMIVLLTLIFSISAFAGEKTVKLTVTGMMCNNCSAKVEKALKGVQGVSDAKVNLEEKSAVITLASESKTTSAMLVKAVDDAGFSATENSTASKKSTSVKKGDGKCEDGCCEQDGHSKTMKSSKKIKKETTKS